ncbi:MAG: type II toxin-antitoxin system HipA family toxin [Gammaproteobacteria bacterium]|nr:type II toxin-antitoxin system HipA family toxin [Gammaproteobacteria bacterium]
MNQLDVAFHGLSDHDPIYMGTLAWHDKKSWFQFSREFLEHEINPSPFGLKFSLELQEASRSVFNGLHGLFHESLPDGWGLFLMHRTFEQNDISFETTTPVERLSYIADRGMGALSYGPKHDLVSSPSIDQELKLDFLWEEALHLVNGAISDIGDCHVVNGAPLAGTTPKLLVGFDGNHAVEGAAKLPSGYSHWIVKLPIHSNSQENQAGTIEFLFAKMAVEAGIHMSPVRLILGDHGTHYFMTRRFDRKGHGRRVHVQSAASLLSLDCRTGSIDYLDLFKLSDVLTHNYTYKLFLFRQMIFNAIAGNQNDHTRNFAFMLTDSKEWSCTPAYDITWSPNRSRGHASSINGRAKDISEVDIWEVAKRASVPKRDVQRVLQQVSEALTKWVPLAREHDIPEPMRTEISSFIERQLVAMQPSTILVSSET